MKTVLILLLSFVLTACGTTNNSSAKKINNIEAANYNLQLGVSYLEQGDVARAKQKLIMAQEEAPKWPPVLSSLGYFYEKTGDIKLAREYYEKSLSYSSRSGSMHNNYGAFLCRQGDYSNAEKHFLIAVTDQTYANTGEAYENAGLCAIKAKDKQKAQYYLYKAYLQDPNRTRTLYQLAQLAYDRAEYKTASNYMTSFERAGPLDAPALLLGYKISRKLLNTIQAYHYADLLKQNYPNSVQYREIQS